MSASTKNIGNWLFSIVGVGIMLVICIGIYIVSHVAALRVDMTEEKLYTLSAGTKAILRKLDTPVQVRFYSSQGKDMPVELKTYSQRVEDLLGEFKKVAGNNIEIKKYDPQPDSDAEEQAMKDGVEGQAMGMGFGDKLYLGLAVSMLEANTTLPFLTPQRERLLEYDLARAISTVTNPQKTVIGIMSGLPVFGESNPMAARMGGGRQDPWIFVSELKKDYTVNEVPMTSETISDDIKVLVVIHPKGITDKAQFMIDQFLMNGGKLIAFLDPMSIIDTRNTPQQNPMQGAMQAGSNLDKLVKAWGLEFDSAKVVADKIYETKINRGQRAESSPAVLTLNAQAVNTNDVATSQIDSLLIPFAGVFTGTLKEGLKETVLLQSSTQSQIIEKFMAEYSGDQVSKNFTPSGKAQKIALRITGNFKTAFPDGAPVDAVAKPDASTNNTSLKESTKETSVVLVGDSDLLYEQFAGQVQDFMGQKMFFPRNGNLNLLQNIVDQMAGDQNLIGIRSRATMTRPFTRVRAIQAAAEDRYRTKIKDLEKSLADTQTRLSELQRTKEGGGAQQRFILSPEQQSEIASFQKKQLSAKRELRVERKNLRQDIDSLENRLKWLNILGIPFLVTLTGLGFAIFKRKITAAK